MSVDELADAYVSAWVPAWSAGRYEGHRERARVALQQVIDAAVLETQEAMRAALWAAMQNAAAPAGLKE